MTHPALIERITRSLAYMLRHQPEEFDLELDAHGYGDAERIVQALNERLGEPVTLADLQDAIRSGDRPRYEIVGNRVRALYGHSIDVEPGEPSRPPELLFVGISARDADRATRYGLRGGRRRFLHLTLTPEDAKEGGRRTGRDYVVITVYALDAWEEGINFYDRKALFLAGQVPTEFLEVSETCHDGSEQELRPAAGGREFSGGRQRGGQGRPERDSREPRAEPIQEPAGGQAYEEEGFGEGTPEAIQVDRDRGTERPGAGAGGFPRGGGEGRGDRGAHPGERPRGGRGRRDEAHSGAADQSRGPQGGGRGRGFEGAPAGAPGTSREVRPFRAERGPEAPRQEPAQDRGAGEPSGRSFREAGGDAHTEPRDFDRGGRPDRGPRQHGRGGDQRQPQPGSREERGPRGGDRGADRGRGDGEMAPAMRPPPPPPPPPSAPRAPEPQKSFPSASEGPGFGLGIFEEPAPQRAVTPPKRAPAPTPSAPPSAPAARENDPFEGFGAGV